MTRIRPYPTLKHWRDAQGLNQIRAAQELGISQAAYSRFERQKSAPNRDLAKRLMVKTGVPLESLMGISL